MYRIPKGVIGLQGTRETFERLERENSPLPLTLTATATDGSGFEIRLFAWPASAPPPDPHATAELGLVLLPPGTEVDVT